MNVDNSSRRKRRRLVSIVIGLFCGAAIGFVIGLLTIRQLPGGVVVGVGGAFFGGVVGGRVIRTTGWLMLVGAIVGGIAAIAVNGNGKAMLYGAPVGMIVGLIVGLTIEEACRKRPG